MAFFTKKPKKTPEELKAEREEKIAATSKSIRLQIAALEEKKKGIVRKIVEAKSKGLKEPEMQARNMLKQIMTSINRESSMLMTLELAIEARDLAELNANFLESIGSLSDEILKSGQTVSDAKVQKTNDKFLRAIFESNQQKERIDAMLDVGQYADIVTQDSNQTAEFDDEIDALVNEAETEIASTPSYSRVKF